MQENELTHYLVPNSTQVPNVLLDEWLPYLKDVELRVLFIIVRQTLGWVENKDTGRRKEQDWISNYQLQQKTGKSGFRVSKAIDSLIKHNLIVALNSTGELLDTSTKRSLSGGRIFFRLNTHTFVQGSFLKPNLTPRTKGVGSKKKANDFSNPPQIVAPTKSVSTKETPFTKLNVLTSGTLVNNKKDQENKDQTPQSLQETESKNMPRKPTKPTNHKVPLPTGQLLGAFKIYCEGIRRITPQFVRFKDGNLIKHALRHLTANDVQMLFLWFLKTCDNMQPTIGSALCKEVVAAYIKASHDTYGFYHEIDQLARQYAKPITKPSSLTEIDASARRLQLLAEMKSKLFVRA